MVPVGTITDLLLAWNKGDDQALAQLTPLVMQELRRLARRHMAGERPGHTLQTSALVNEAYLRLIDVRRVQWQNRAHFFGMSSRLMRRILVDFARHRQYLKRGGEAVQVTFDEQTAPSRSNTADILAIDDALTALEAVDTRKARVVELRFFGGLTTEEIAEALQISTDTVLRDWNFAKVWLGREMKKR